MQNSMNLVVIFKRKRKRSKMHKTKTVRENTYVRLSKDKG